MNESRVIQVGQERRRPRPPKPEGTPPKQPKGNRKKRVSHERFGSLNSFVDVTMRNLTRAEIAVWWVIFRDTRMGVASAALSDISQRTGTSVRHVQKAIQRLTSRGLIERVHRGGLNRGCSTYRIYPVEPPSIPGPDCEPFRSKTVYP